MSDQDPLPVSLTKARGRPCIEQRLEPVSTSLPAPYYARLKEIARDRDVSVSKLVRQLLILRLR